MALEKLVFTKKWTNSDAETGFPTHESQESQVREDLQYLHDETAAALNKLIDDLKAGEVPFVPTSGKITKANVQEAVEYVYDELSKAAAGTIVDNSVTSAGLRKVSGEEAVTTATIRDGAVTNAKIAGGITADKMSSSFWSNVTVPDDSISNAKLKEKSVKNRNIEQYTIEGDRLMSGIILNTHIADYDSTKQSVTEDTGIGTSKLKDGAITDAKVSNVSASKITGELSSSHLASGIPFSKLSASAVAATAASIGTTDTQVSVTGVTANSVIIVSPAIASYDKWNNYSVYCTGQGAGYITLKAASTVTDVTVNVLIFN